MRKCRERKREFSFVVSSNQEKEWNRVLKKVIYTGIVIAVAEVVWWGCGMWILSDVCLVASSAGSLNCLFIFIDIKIILFFFNFIERTPELKWRLTFGARAVFLGPLIWAKARLIFSVGKSNFTCLREYSVLFLEKATHRCRGYKRVKITYEMIC